MAGVPISTQQMLRFALVFALLIIGFAVLSSITGWPDKSSWSLVVILAAAIAALPILGPTLEFLRESGAVVDIKGFKLDFSASAAHATKMERVNFDNQLGTPVSDTNAKGIAEAAKAAQEAPIVVVDLGIGKSWYATRLFVLGAVAVELGGARAIVLLAQKGGIASSFVGWLPPRDVVTAFCTDDARYATALSEARTILHHLRLSGGDRNYVFPPVPAGFDFGNFLYAYQATGDLAFVPALIARIQAQPPAVAGAAPPPAPQPLENSASPAYLTREDAERLLDPWLIRDHIEDSMDDAEKRRRLARADRGYLAITEANGSYRGMIDVASALRRAVFAPPAAAAGAK